MVGRDRSPGLDPAAELDDFLFDHKVDASAADELRAQTDDVIRAVLGEGPIHGGRNASAIVMSRIRDARRGGGRSFEAPPPPPAAEAPPLRRRSRSRNGGYDRGGHRGHHRPRAFDGFEQQAIDFVSGSDLDEGARESFLSQPPEVQQAVMDEGMLSGRNHSAILHSRIRRILANGPPYHAASLPTLGMPPPGGERRPSGQVPPWERGRDWSPPRPAHHSRPRSRSRSPIREFAEAQGLDAKAEQKLRGQTLFVRQRVFSEGNLTGRNPSAVLTGRIKRICENERAEREKAVAEFAEANRLDDSACEELLRQPTDVLAAVIEEGPAMGRNASAAIMSRLRRHGEGPGFAPPPPPVYPQGYSRSPRGYSPPRGRQEAPRGHSPPWERRRHSPERERWPRSPLRDPIRRRPSPGRWRETLAAWADAQRLDDAALDHLMRLPRSLQQRILDEGPVLGRNPSAVFLSRVRRLEDDEPGYQPWEPRPPLPPVPPPRPELSRSRRDDGYRRSSSPISEFARENGLDERAVQKLRDQPRSVQDAIIQEGPLTGRNPSAILSSRIRRAIESQPKDVQDFDDEILRFADENSLDERSINVLREISPDTRALLMEEGPLTGRNPNAVLLGRLKRVRNSR